MKCLSIFLLIFASFSITFGQDSNTDTKPNPAKNLIINNTRTSVKTTILPDKKITVWTIENGLKTKYFGNFSIQDSTSILLNREVIKLNNIIKIQQEEKVARTISGTTMVVGIAGLIPSVIFLNKHNNTPQNYTGWGIIDGKGLGLVSGVFCSGVLIVGSGIVLLITKKIKLNKYKTLIIE